MDGHNEDLLFRNKLRDEFSIKYIGICPLHVVNSAFGKVVKSLKESVVNLNGMAIDFHFVKQYAAQREQHTACHEITGVTAKMVEKDVETQWLSLQKVLLRIMEQWKILPEYFIKKVLTPPDFSGTIGGFSTLRYAHIKGPFQIKNIPIVFLHKILKNLLKRLKLMRE